MSETCLEGIGDLAENTQNPLGSWTFFFSLVVGGGKADLDTEEGDGQDYLLARDPDWRRGCRLVLGKDTGYSGG